MQQFHLSSLLLFTLVLLSQLLLQVGLAHENQLSGLVYMKPQSPIPDEAFVLTLELIDPEGAYIPEAIVKLSIPDLELEQQFAETTQVGIYTIELSLPEGKWLTDITEATFENESNTIQLGLNVGTENREIIELLFPTIDSTSSELPTILVFVGLAVAALLSLIIILSRLKGFRIDLFHLNLYLKSSNTE